MPSHGPLSGVAQRRLSPWNGWLKATLAPLIVLAACAQSPIDYVEEADLDMDVDDASATQGGSSEAGRDDDDDELDAGSEPSEGPSGQMPPTPSGSVRDAAPPSTPEAGSTRADAAAPASNDASMRPPTTTPRDAGGGVVDAAGPAPTDAATPPDPKPPVVDASTPPPAAMTCATTPSYPTANACSQCICAKCATQVMGCYASSDSTKNTQCKQVQECAETNRCASTDCYCGDSAICLNPNGRCESVITRVAGTDSPLDIQRLSSDSASPIGRANQIGLCSRERCQRECGL
jgi:hypothetical protein